ncbi:hypothetical protein GH714_013998 [Hevea brasiliensis]|uniref:DOG1 domain-containing protein n=1 Tax=Hevea brasiliensis TaxID=3981 RepID=A0A6A6LST8_HEVBR|nr:hypothetical protein GH714_013998 [Hevea brasiliensis]
MERQQVAVADRKMEKLVRLVVRVKNGEQVRQVEGLVQVALKGVMAGQEKVMKATDCVRLRTLKGVLDVLNPTMWKPSAVFKLVNSIRTNGVPILSLVELTQEHMRKIETLRVKIRLEEEKVEREMERQQVVVVDRKMAELVRLVVRVKNGEEVRQVERLVQVHERSNGRTGDVMKAVDCVRLRTLKGVLDVLSPLQYVSSWLGLAYFKFFKTMGKEKGLHH